MDNGVCDGLSAFNRWSDALSHIQGRQAGSISCNIDGPGLAEIIRLPQIVIVSAGPVTMIGDQAKGLQLLDETIPMHADMGIVPFHMQKSAANAGVDITAFFRDIPGISGQVLLKKP